MPPTAVNGQDAEFEHEPSLPRCGPCSMMFAVRRPASGVAAGSIVRLDNIGAGTIAANVGTVVSPLAGRGSNRGLAAGDEVLYAYQGSAATPTFLTAVANGGWLVTPHLVERPTPRTWIGLKPATLAVLRDGLRQVVTNGTATLLNNPNLPPVAGKTGTGEDPPRPDHSWFGGYAPVDRPTLVIIAFGENSGGYGGTVAAPMVKELMTTWFRRA